MKIYNINDLKDSQIMYKQKPLILVVFLLISILLTVLILVVITININQPVSSSLTGTFKSFDRQILTMPEEGEITLHLSPFDRDVRKDELIATIKSEKNLIEIKSPKNGIFDVEPTILNGAVLEKGSSIGTLTNPEQLYVVVEVSQKEIRNINTGDEVEIHSDESSKNFEGRVIDRKVVTSSNKDLSHHFSIKLNNPITNLSVIDGTKAEVILKEK